MQPSKIEKNKNILSNIQIKKSIENIYNSLKEELYEKVVVAKFATVQKERNRKIKRNII